MFVMKHEIIIKTRNKIILEIQTLTLSQIVGNLEGIKLVTFLSTSQSSLSVSDLVTGILQLEAWKNWEYLYFYTFPFMDWPG